MNTRGEDQKHSVLLPKKAEASDRCSPEKATRATSRDYHLVNGTPILVERTIRQSDSP